MKRRDLTILTGVIAALAMMQAPAQALNVKVGAGGVHVDIGDGGGGGRSGVHVGVGGGTVGTATATVGTGSTAPTTADVQLSLGGNKGTDHATVDLNGDGVINGEDDALVALDINGDGILNGLDDVNGDGLLSVLDLGDIPVGATIGTFKLPSVSAKINLGGGKETGATVNRTSDAVQGEVDVGDVTGDLPIGSINLPDVAGLLGGVGGQPPGVVPPPGNGEPPIGIRNPIPGQDRRDIDRVVGSLDNHDVIALKVRCADVLGNPGSFDATTISVCRVLATR